MTTTEAEISSEQNEDQIKQLKRQLAETALKKAGYDGVVLEEIKAHPTIWAAFAAAAEELQTECHSNNTQALQGTLLLLVVKENQHRADSRDAFAVLEWFAGKEEGPEKEEGKTLARGLLELLGYESVSVGSATSRPQAWNQYVSAIDEILGYVSLNDVYVEALKSIVSDTGNKRKVTSLALEVLKR